MGRWMGRWMDGSIDVDRTGTARKGEKGGEVRKWPLPKAITEKPRTNAFSDGTAADGENADDDPNDSDGGHFVPPLIRTEANRTAQRGETVHEAETQARVSTRQHAYRAAQKSVAEERDGHIRCCAFHPHGQKNGRTILSSPFIYPLFGRIHPSQQKGFFYGSWRHTHTEHNTINQ